MFKIDSSGNIDNQFTEGDPGNNVPATVVSADWLNAVQGEICNVITNANITLAKACGTQLLAAIQKFAGHGWLRQWVAGNYTTLADFNAASDKLDYGLCHSQSGEIFEVVSTRGASSTVLYSMVVYVPAANTSVNFELHEADDTAYLYVDDTLVHTFNTNTDTLQTQTYTFATSGEHLVQIMLNNSGGSTSAIKLAQWIDEITVKFERAAIS